jgi:hypothetical protein
LDWDRDGVVDTRQDNSSFDKNGNSIADWLEESTDQNWVYNGNNGWDDVATLNPEQASGPTAEDVRSMYNVVAQGQAAQYNSWGVPNSQYMNDVAQLMKVFEEDHDVNSTTSTKNSREDWWNEKFKATDEMYEFSKSLNPPT